MTSPQLQVGQLVQVSDSAGSYKFVDLPAGTYRLKAELTGFSSSIREDLRLTVGFNARIDLTLKLGAMEESVTVSGQSPVVDVSSTTASVAFTKEVLDAIPRGRDLQNVFAMAPGRHAGRRRCRRQHDGAAPEPVQLRRVVAAEAAGRGHEHHDGRGPEHRHLFQRQHARRGADQDLGQRCRGVGAGNFDGRDHEVGRQRLSWHVSGLHGIAEIPGRQPERRLAGAGAHRHVAAEELLRPVGGSRRRIIRDKLWFYGAYGRQSKNEGLLGFASGPGPDGKYLTADDPLANVETSLSQMSAKLSYQLTKNNRLVYAWQRGTKAQPQNNADRFTPLESTRDYKNPTAIQKIELQSMINPRVLVNAVAGYSGYVTDYDAARSYARADAPPRQDLATTLNTGSAPLHQNKTRDRFQTDDSISFFPERSFAGKHEFKTGISIYLDKSSDGYSNNLACNCILYTDTIGGVPNTPSQIRIYNTPVVPADHDNIYAWYLKDSWRATSKLTINLGVRIERQHSFLPAQDYRGRARLADGIPGGIVPANRRAEAHPCGASYRLRLGYRRQVGREGDVRPLQLHARRHLCRRLQQECDRERRVHLARSERRQALSARRSEPQI